MAPLPTPVEHSSDPENRLACAGLLAEYVGAVKMAMNLDTIVKCRLSGDYSLTSSAGSSAPVTGLQKAWRIYR
jgi:hypothetical protein